MSAQADVEVMDRDDAPAQFEAFAHAVAGDIEILAILHDREPSRATVDALQACPLSAQLGLVLREPASLAALDAFATAVAALPRAGSDGEAAAMDELAAGYADVYLRHAYRAAPNESVWLTEDGLERQGPMFAVRAWYRRNGLTVTDWASRPDDHLVIELRFLAHVLNAGRSVDGLREAARFLDAHLLRWIKLFAERLVATGAPDLYAAQAVLTAAYLDELRDHLTSITGIARAVPAPAPEPSCETRAQPYLPGMAPSW